MVTLSILHDEDWLESILKVEFSQNWFSQITRLTQNKKTGEFISVFGNGMLNGYIDSHAGEQFTFLCEGQNSFIKDGKHIDYTKICNFTRIQKPDIM